MFDARMDMKWVGPLVTRAVEALESIAESHKQLAKTARLQSEVLDSHKSVSNNVHVRKPLSNPLHLPAPVTSIDQAARDREARKHR